MRAHAMSTGDWISLIVLSVVWGGSFFFFKILVAELPVLTIVMLRVVGAAIILLAIVYLTRGSMPSSPTIWASFAIMGIFNNLIPFSLIIWSESHIQSGLASILNATTPLFSVLLAHVLTKDEPLTLNRILGVLIGVVGVAALMGPSALTGLNLTSLAQLACIAASISYAWVAIYGRRFRGLGIPPLVTATGQTVASAIIITPFALWLNRPWTPVHAPSLGVWGAMIGLIVLSTVFAYVLYFRILVSAGATNVVLVTFLTPVSALLLGRFILQERLSSAALIGMLLIFGGLAAIDGRLFRIFRRAA
jgi:drug/metabolite transporter (DMT)-like permease